MRLSVAAQARRLSPTVERTAYRIVQESLTNVLRHAGTASAAVTLTYGEDRIGIEVADETRGEHEARLVAFHEVLPAGRGRRVPRLGRLPGELGVRPVKLEPIWS
jgi:signal transduction histidine kinase